MDTEAFYIMIVPNVEYLKAVVVIALGLVEHSSERGCKICS